MSLAGIWELESSENFEEYLKELGIGYFLRKLSKTIRQTLTIINDGKNWTIKNSSSFKDFESSYEEDVEEHKKTPDGKESKVILTLVNGKMTIIQRDANIGNVLTEVNREIADGKLIETLRRGKVVAIRKFKRIS